MRYCERCGQVWSDTSSYAENTPYDSCWVHGKNYVKDDGVLGKEYDIMSEKEKDEYDKQLIYKIEHSDKLDWDDYNMYSNPQKTPNFYFFYRYDKYEKLTGKRAGRKHNKKELHQIKKQMDEEFERLYGKNSPAYQEQLMLNQIKEQKERQQQFAPKCPTCGSPNIEKISVGKKIFGGAMFGLFSSDVRNSMRCKNCGYKW